MRNVHHLDRRTHRSLIEPISNFTHLKTMLVSRFVTYAHKTLGSRKFAARFLSNLNMSDNRTLFGRNISNVMHWCQTAEFLSLNSSTIKNNVKYWQEGCEEWRLSLVNDLLGLRNGSMELEGFSRGEISEMLTHACID